MLQLMTFLSVLAIALSAVLPEVQQAPEFCHNLDCPKYNTIKAYKEGYELRQYESSKWVATNFSAPEFTRDINMQMFYRLFYYIAGNNTKHMKIPMTAPVLTNITHGAGPDCDSLFEMHFMIPFDIQEDTPTPTDPKIYLSSLEGIKVYVKSFGGFPQEKDYVQKAAELADEINDNSKFYSDFYLTAGYDGPDRFTNRHNEVWLVAKE